MATKKKVTPTAKKKTTKPAIKKATTSSKAKTDKKVEASQKIKLDHNFSFNLLTEKWIPVVSIKGERRLLSLNEFLKHAHEMERFDFPLPGLETAVIRFLVAIVYIVGVPNDKNEWENWYKKGKFDEEFIKELQKYKERLDLFSKTEPFLQEVEFTENKLKSSKEFKIIDFLPSGSNSNHFANIFLKNGEEITISPQASIILLLFHQMIPRASKAGPYEQYLNGLLGQTVPYFITLNGPSIFHSIISNVFDKEFIRNNLKDKVFDSNSGWIDYKPKEYLSNEISLAHGLLWKSRSVLLLPTERNNSICSILGISTDVVVSSFCYSPQKAMLKNKDVAPWEDPFNSIIKDIERKKNSDKVIIKKRAPRGKGLPSWQDFPSLIITRKSEKDNKSNYSFSPLIIQRIFSYEILNPIINLLSVTTKDGQDKVYQITESKFPFKPSFIQDEQIALNLKLIVQQTKSFEGKILFSLILANKLEEKVKTKQGKKIRETILTFFQSAYWHELGSYFEESLVKLVESDQYADEVYADWKKVLASHVRKTFERHTEKLIHNPKNLKAYENGRRYLTDKIRKELLKEKQ